jgi:signal recognition particle GTPase
MNVMATDQNLDDDVNELTNNDDYLSLINDEIKEIPECCEKIILNLIYVISINIDNEEKLRKIEIDVEINHLKERLKKEELWFHSYEEDLYRIQSSFKNSEYKESVKWLKNLMNKIRIIDIKLIHRLIKSNEQDLNFIRNKNIYMLLGLTGSGE